MTIADRLAKLRGQVARGDDVQRVYGSPVVKELFAKIKNELRREWENTKPDAAAEREHQWRLHQVVQMFEETFTATIRQGSVANKELKKLLDPKE